MKRSINDNLKIKGGYQNIIDAPRNDIYVVLDNIRSMHNVGAIFRTCDAVRVKTLFLCGITATPPREQISKTALNTIDYVPWKYYKITSRLISILKKRGVQIVALEQTDSSIDYRKFSYRTPLAIIIGNEIDGVSNKVLSLCDGIVELPMLGIANSLNAATATGIILYHLIS